mgnify:CR=1 FL=1
MAFSRLELKIISIIQLVMSVILFALGIDAMLDSSSCKYTCPGHRTTGVLLPTLMLLTVKYEKFEVHGEDIKLLILLYDLLQCY